MVAGSQTDAVEDYNIKQVFAEHLNLALKTMPPPQAFEAAQHATRAYLDSHEFIDLSGKGQPPAWKMVAKKNPSVQSRVKGSKDPKGEGR